MNSSVAMASSSPDYTYLFLLGVAAIGGYIIRYAMDKTKYIQEKLREDRREVYFDLLDPFIFMFSNMPLTDSNKKEKLNEKFKSETYRKASFEVILLGSDEVVRAYNDMMQSTFHSNEVNENAPKYQNPVIGLARLLLEMRKDFETKTTKLTEKDMLRSMITDIDNIEFPVKERKNKAQKK